MMFDFPCDDAGSNYIIEALLNMTLYTHAASKPMYKKKCKVQPVTMNIVWSTHLGLIEWFSHNKYSYSIFYS